MSEGKNNFEDIENEAARILAMPAEEEVRTRLKNKKEDYLKRIEWIKGEIAKLGEFSESTDDAAKERAAKHIEKGKRVIRDAKYKVLVIDMLFDKGSATVEEILEAITEKEREQDQEPNPDLYINACEVIRHYLTRGV